MSLAVLIPPVTWRRSSASPRPASTRSMCTRSVPIKRDSSGSTPTKYSRICDVRPLHSPRTRLICDGWTAALVRSHGTINRPSGQSFPRRAGNGYECRRAQADGTRHRADEPPNTLTRMLTKPKLTKPDQMDRATTTSSDTDNFFPASGRRTHDAVHRDTPSARAAPSRRLPRPARRAAPRTVVAHSTEALRPGITRAASDASQNLCGRSCAARLGTAGVPTDGARWSPFD